MNKTAAMITERMLVRDALFAEVALRMQKISPEVIQKGHTVQEEMTRFGIGRALGALLVDRKLIDRELEKEVLREIGRIALACPRCRKSLPLEEMSPEGHVRCAKCKNMMKVVWIKATGENDQEQKIEERLKVEILQGAEARVGPGKGEPPPAKAPPSSKPPKARGSVASGPFGAAAQKNPGSPSTKSPPSASTGPAAPGISRDLSRDISRDISRDTAPATPKPPSPGRKEPPRPRDGHGEKGKKSPAEPEAPPLVEPVTATPRVNVRRAIKKYRILSVLSNGPHGRLYLARLRSSAGEAEVMVLKVLSMAQPDRKAVAMLRERLQAWSTLHPESPDPPHSLEAEESILYVVRPYLGESYTALSDFRPENPGQKGQILKAVAAHLKTIHALGGVHGNLKPSNIFIRKKDSRVFLVDPGMDLLLPRSNKLARWQLLADSPRFVSPEEIDGDELSPASDVYSLGWVFYSMLAGAAPFENLAPPEVLRCHQVGPCPELPPELGGWTALHTAMTALEPRERPNDAAAVLEQVDAILAGKKPVLAAVNARPAPLAEELEGLGASRRLSWRYALGPVALILSIAWLGWCYQGWRQVRDTVCAPNPNLMLFNRLAEETFMKKSIEARSQPEQAREIWDKYLKLFSGSTIAEVAERERRAYQPVNPPPKR